MRHTLLTRGARLAAADHEDLRALAHALLVLDRAGGQVHHACDMCDMCDTCMAHVNIWEHLRATWRW